MSTADPATTAASGADPTRPLVQLLLLLRVALHMMFAFLLAFGLLRYLADDRVRVHTTPVLPLACTLAVVYLLGTLWEGRFARGHTSLNPLSSAPWWLVAVTVLWIGLVFYSPDFVWLLFPLVFLFLHLLSRGIGLMAVVVLWAVAAFGPALLHPGGWGISAVIGPLIGAAFAVAAYYTYRALHSEARHHQQVAEQLRTTREELALSEHQAGRLEERERLSREIHDTVAQGLSSILLVSRAAANSLRQGDTAATFQQLETIEGAAGDNLAEARRFVRDLAAPSLAADLPTALREVIRRVEDRQQALGQSPLISLQLAGDVHRELPETVATAVVRACQEALTNVVKHAAADTVVVTLAVWDLELTLDVFDDGTGFDPAAVGTNSYGLQGLYRRLAALSGHLTIESEPGEGTVLAIQIPLTSARSSQKEI